MEYMRDIYDCVDAFASLLNTEYEIVLGRKGVAVTLRITFDKKDCYHLMGLQYLTDRPELNRDRGLIFDQIYNRIIKKEQIESSDKYHLIAERVDFLPLLEKIMDSNDTMFKYNKKTNAFSMIEADYLMKTPVFNRNVYVFLSKNKDDQYFCRSFFPEAKRDYTKNQASWTLLYKKKMDKSTGREIILYNKLKTK
jgi:hypothetical protein